MTYLGGVHVYQRQRFETVSLVTASTTLNNYWLPSEGLYEAGIHAALHGSYVDGADPDGGPRRHYFGGTGNTTSRCNATNYVDRGSGHSPGVPGGLLGMGPDTILAGRLAGDVTCCADSVRTDSLGEENTSR